MGLSKRLGVQRGSRRPGRCWDGGNVNEFDKFALAPLCYEFALLKSDRTNPDK